MMSWTDDLKRDAALGKEAKVERSRRESRVEKKVAAAEKKESKRVLRILNGMRIPKITEFLTGLASEGITFTEEIGTVKIYKESEQFPKAFQNTTTDLAPGSSSYDPAYISRTTLKALIYTVKFNFSVGSPAHRGLTKKVLIVTMNTKDQFVMMKEIYRPSGFIESWVPINLAGARSQIKEIIGPLLSAHYGR